MCLSHHRSYLIIDGEIEKKIIVFTSLMLKCILNSLKCAHLDITSTTEKSDTSVITSSFFPKRSNIAIILRVDLLYM